MENHNQITVVIAEDDAILRDTMTNYFELFSDVTLLASFSNGEQLIEEFIELKPNVVFLDIMLPDINGLNLANKLREIKPDIYLVFVTGYAEYAATAFQLDAVDYLVKPVNKESISCTLDKLRRRLKIRSNEDNPDETIVIKNKHDLYFLKKDSILYLEKELRKTIIHTHNGRYTTNEPLSSLKSKFEAGFFRCHKSFLVNFNKIEKVYPINERVYGITFLNYSGEAIMGRKAFKEFCSLITRKRR